MFTFLLSPNPKPCKRNWLNNWSEQLINKQKVCVGNQGLIKKHTYIMDINKHQIIIQTIKHILTPNKYLEKLKRGSSKLGWGWLHKPTFWQIRFFLSGGKRPRLLLRTRDYSLSLIFSLFQLCCCLPADFPHECWSPFYFVLQQRHVSSLALTIIGSWTDFAAFAARRKHYCHCNFPQPNCVGKCGDDESRSCTLILNCRTLKSLQTLNCLNFLSCRWKHQPGAYGNNHTP